MRRSKKTFTLVEMIVVIIILAIIAGISSVSLVKWFGQSRDVKRKADINILIGALESFQYKNDVFPDPDDGISINYSGINIGTQGKIGESISTKLQLKSLMKDPYDKSYYMYSINQFKSAFQIGVFLELSDSEQIQVTYSTNSVYAQDYSERYPFAAGLGVGIFLIDGTNQPIDDLLSGYDIKTSNQSCYLFFPNKQSISGTGNTLISTLSSYRSELGIYDLNLVGYWPFEETYGSVIHDSSSYYNTGVSSGSPEWVEGLRGIALEFDGVDDVVNIADSASLDISTGFTLSAWVNPSKLPTLSLNGIVGKVDNSASNTVYGFVLNNNGKIGGYVNSTSSEVNSVLGIGKWSHVVQVYNGSNVKYYINGTLITNVAYSSPINSSTYPLKIGSSTNLFFGKIDEVRLYNRALTDNEVMLLYSAK